MQQPIGFVHVESGFSFKRTGAYPRGSVVLNTKVGQCNHGQAKAHRVMELLDTVFLSRSSVVCLLELDSIGFMVGTIAQYLRKTPKHRQQPSICAPLYKAEGPSALVSHAHLVACVTLGLMGK